MTAGQTVTQPPQAAAAQRFLAQRGWTAALARAWRSGRIPLTSEASSVAAVQAQGSAASTWQALGPAAVNTPHYGLVTGRVTSLALDPADATGNRLYVGTTGGGVWVAQNAATAAAGAVTFAPLTDGIADLSATRYGSLSIGALTVQPGGTGVILAGTGDPNDALDSYYGGGILRSTDNGKSWALISSTQDLKSGLAAQDFSFAGLGFAEFAWSTTNPQVVVAAVSQAYEGALVGAVTPGTSCMGLYYSTDAGATWHIASITDGPGQNVQGPLIAFPMPAGNAATAVVWNPVRRIFVAAVRFHGYYQSTDGVTWTRMAAQPGTNLTTKLCPNNLSTAGSIACPIFRGALAVNPISGDTFAWTVDLYDQDQGLWQDACNLSGGACASSTVSFGKQWSTTGLEQNTAFGPMTIANGDYNLTLAAIPQQQDTVLLAGDNDVWRCTLAMGCVWRNTTNATTCMSAQVAEYQHALEWSVANPLEVFVGNDGGLWRSLDAVGETGQVCAASDAAHYQNLNGSLGSLADVESLPAVGDTPYTMMAGLGVNGTAASGSTSGPTADWTQILGGDGGVVAIDPRNSSNWYVNNGAGVSIHGCTKGAACTAGDFGMSPLVDSADVGGDGDTMVLPAPFLVDPLDTSQLLIGTCRVWRGPAGGGWTASDAISRILDTGMTSGACRGNALIRTMAALPMSGGGERVYVGMYGALDGGANLAGHVLTAVVNPATSGAPVWQDVTLNPVTNDPRSLNYYGMDISSVTIDSHDATGSTVYVTVEGMTTILWGIPMVYRSTDGGAHWANITSNLPLAPANSVAVDPQNAGTVYVATDRGVYFTANVAGCIPAGAACWSPFGAGLPRAPVVALSASPASASAQVLVAATYGRGIWQTPLWTGGSGLTTAVASPTSLSFPSQMYGGSSAAQTVTLTNTGSVALSVSGIVMSSDFTETDTCQAAPVAVGASCSIQVIFTPAATGARTGSMTISANLYGVQVSVALSGTGTPAGAVTANPTTVNFGQVQVGSTSPRMQVTVDNASATDVPVSSITITPPFAIASNVCGVNSLVAHAGCQILLTFTPTQTGPASGTLILNDGAGTQTVLLTGTGLAVANDVLSPTALNFAATAAGQLSTAQTVTLTNSGDAPLTGITVTVSGPFREADDCTMQLAAHAVCTISVTFAPTQVGNAAGVLTVADALRTQTVALSGTGAQPAALSVTPASLSFAQQPPGVASAPLTLTVSNSGGVTMANVGFQITGTSASSFSTGATSCGTSLASGASCTVQVVFTPATTGGSTATLTASSSTLGVAPVTVALSGLAQAASGLTASPAQLSFAPQNPGQTSAAQTVTVRNTSNYPFTGLTLAASGPFRLTQDTCAASLAASGSCTVGVVFTPTSNTGATGLLTVSSPSVSMQATVALAGEGGIQVTPGTLPAFASTGVGTMSAPATVTVTNLATSTALSGLALTISAGAPFTLVSNSCGATLAAGASCTAGVEFAPVNAGQQTGSLTVTSGTLQATPIALAGMGFDFTASLTGATSVNIASGQTASYTLALAGVNGSAGTFSFTCGSLPANAQCVFSPNTMALSAGGQGNVTVQIVTGVTSGSAGPGPGVWRALPVLCGLLLPLALVRRRRALLLAVLVAAALLGGVASCSGSGGGTGGISGSGPGGGGSKTGSTPAGTYSIPITVASTGVQHSVTVTLTVD